MIAAVTLATTVSCSSSADNAASTFVTTNDSGVVASDALSVIVDTDVSLDDALAILYMLRRPDIDIRAITVTGTGVVRCEAGVSIVLGLLAVSSRQSVPVACGSETPLEGDNSFPSEWRDARDKMANAGVLSDGGEPSPLSASDLIAAAAADSPTPATVVLLGPHTNFAQALRDHDDLEPMLAAVHMMGGALDVPGNTIDNLEAEWNLWIDPVANAEVFATDLPLTIVPLDATDSVPLTEPLAALLEANQSTPEAKATVALLRLDPGTTTSGLFMWDQLAVVALVEPHIVTFSDLDVEVSASLDPTDSGTLTAGSGRRARVANGANRVAFETEYVATLTGLDLGAAPAASAEKLAYIAQADAVCSAQQAKVVAIYTSVDGGPGPDEQPTAEFMLDVWTQLRPLYQEQVDALRAIAPPPEDEEALSTLFEAFEQAFGDIDALIDAAVAGDQAALDQLTGNSAEGNPFQAVEQQAQVYGFSACAGAG